MQDSEPDIIDGVGAEAGHVIRTTIGGNNGKSKQVSRKLIWKQKNIWLVWSLFSMVNILHLQRVFCLVDRLLVT